MRSSNRFAMASVLSALLTGVAMPAGLSADTPAQSSGGKTAAAQPGSADQQVDAKLLAQYSNMLKELQADIAKTLPALDEQKIASFKKARDAVKAAVAAVAESQKSLDKIAGAEGLVGHRKGKWIGGAEKGIAAAEAALKKATTDAERDAARKDLAKWQADLEAGKKALVEALAALDAAKADEAKHIQASKAAKDALASAEADELTAAKALLSQADSYLTSDKLDAKLVKCAVLENATPKVLAEFAQQGKEQEALLNNLLADAVLMKQMLEAGGAKNGKYGQAMQIYTAIQSASPRAKDGVFQRLALGTCLEHAVPIAQSNPKADTKAPAMVDPVKRYQHFEKAFLAGELDPGVQEHVGMGASQCRER